MDNRKKRKTNKQNPKKNTNTNTEVLNAEEEKVHLDKTVQKNVEGNTENKKTEKPQKKENSDTQKIAAPKAEATVRSNAEPDNTKNSEIKKESTQKEKDNKEANHKQSIKKDESKDKVPGKDLSSEHMRGTAMNAAKILLPVAACAIVIAVIISYISSHKSQAVDNPALNMADGSNTAGVAALSDEPLAQNAYTDVNELMQAFCTAMADGDMDTVQEIKDYNTDKEIITYKEKSAFIEGYDNINCYTKPGVEENSYFVYVTYDVKFKDIETRAPGLNAFYVYTAEDGSLKIDGDTEENIKAAFKLVTSQDDVVDLYNKINVNYNEATASDETLSQFMEELPATIRTSVGVALAQLESGETPQTEAGSDEPQSTEESSETEELPQNQVVNQIVRTTDTVNVRSSDSEEADKIGKAQAGTELKRVEDRVNGWSKVIFEDKEAYIKSDYLEVVTEEAAEATGEQTEVIGTITATTNVNVRSEAKQDSEKIGSAQAGTSYNLLEDQGEWYKIDYNGKTGFVKAEYFIR